MNLMHAGEGVIPVVQPGDATGIFSLLWLVIALPLLGALVLLVGGRRTDKWGHLLGTAMAVGSFVLSTLMLIGLMGREEGDRAVAQHLWDWVTVGDFSIGFDLLVDPLSILFMMLITGVGSLIHVYSIGYMEHDPRRRRFFAYLNLFVAAMLMLVLAENYLGVFLGWEGVGLASYLLIGFWQHKPSAAAAAKKAFVINRVGDIGMSLAIAMFFVTFGSTSFTVISANASGASEGALTAIGFLRPGEAPADPEQAVVVAEADIENAVVPASQKLRWLLSAFRLGLPVACAKLSVAGAGRLVEALRRGDADAHRAGAVQGRGGLEHRRRWAVGAQVHHLEPCAPQQVAHDRRRQGVAIALDRADHDAAPAAPRA